MKCSTATESPRSALLSTAWGLFLAFTSGLFSSVYTVIVKYLEDVHPLQLVLYRCWGMASFALPKLVSSQENILGPPLSRKLLFFLGISVSTATIFMFFAFRYLPLGEAAVLFSCSPALTIIAGRLFLKESLGLLHIIAVVNIILGMIFISDFYGTVIQGRATYTAEQIYGLSAVFASLLFSASMVILLRKLKDVDFSVMMFTSSVIGVIEAAITTSLIADFTLNCRGLQQWLILLLVLFAYLGLACGMLSLRFAEAGPVSTITAASDVMFSFVWQVIIFDDEPKALAVLGAVLVCISIIIVGFIQRLSVFLPQKFSKLC